MLVPIPGESLKDEFQRMLRELVQSPEDERAERLILLLVRLKRGGPEAVPVILDFLRTGRDLPRETMVGKNSAYRSNGNLSSFRQLLTSTLVELGQGDPKLNVEVAKAVLPGAHTLGEVLKLIEEAEKVEPGAVRSEAIDALRRLAGEKRNGITDFPKAMALMARLHAEELVPLYAAELEKRPYSLEIEGFLAALWGFPDEIRMQMSQRMIDSATVREKLRGYPSSWQWLDFRQPDFRAAVVEDFRQQKKEEFQMYLIRALPDGKSSAASAIMRTVAGNAAPGAPGTREQAIARLALLDELEPYCKTPLLQQHLADSRKKLTVIAEKP